MHISGIHKVFVAAVVAVALPAASASAAIPLTVNGGWQAFNFGSAGSAIENEPFIFTLTGPGVFKITDAFLSGDQFEIFINGVSHGLTSVPVAGSNVSDDYAAAFASPAFSSASYQLGAGAYSVTGIVTLSSRGGGGGAEVVAVPEPATWAMLIAGFGMVGAGLRRRAALA
ncbi:MAG: PEPxxWA-CTERM sorting domain-containing protein [Sphingomonadaceae bacterium]